MIYLKILSFLSCSISATQLNFQSLDIESVRLRMSHTSYQNEMTWNETFIIYHLHMVHILKHLITWFEVHCYHIPKTTSYQSTPIKCQINGVLSYCCSPFFSHHQTKNTESANTFYTIKDISFNSVHDLCYRLNKRASSPYFQ